jgi:glycosyltransferase involved in cell wall biosynthesis
VQKNSVFREEQRGFFQVPDRMPDISVVVCTYNRGGLLIQTLTSLVNQSLQKSSYEVIVINNNSSDDTQAVAEQFSKNHHNVKVVIEKQQGLSHARNRGLKEARGTYVAYIDDDAKASPDWCERIVHAFQNVSPAPAAVGGEIHPFYESERPKWFSDELEIRTWGDHPQFLKPPEAKNGFSGSNMAFPKSILIEFYGFSTHFGMVGRMVRLSEDTELFNRIYPQKPWFWYDPAIRVYHLVPKRNMRISYRMKRSFKAGSARYQIEYEQSTLYTRFRNLAGLFLFILKALLQLLTTGAGRKKLILKKLQELSYRLGYLVG